MKTAPALSFAPLGQMENPRLLGRYLPALPQDLAQEVFRSFPHPQPWALEPFGASPAFALQLAHAGARVLVCAPNPVIRFLLDLEAQPPSPQDLSAALADLASARKDGERLETHLQSLYLTRCPSCGSEIPAQAFVWQKEPRTLVGRVFRCHCGAGGELPATPEDQQRALAWSGAAGLHRSRILGRVAPQGDPDREFAEEALQTYPPRALYALGSLSNRLETIYTTAERRRCMQALLLGALDASLALGEDSESPPSLGLPPVFREQNVWLALEQTRQTLSAADALPTPLTLYPEEPPESGGVCVFEGALRQLAPHLPESGLNFVAGVLPRLSQAFWVFSALWAGWLWGQDAANPFKSALRRRRYDWAWQTQALGALFGALPALPVFGFFAEPEPGLVGSAFLAAAQAGWSAEALTLLGDAGILQTAWRKLPQPRRAPLVPGVFIARRLLLSLLRESKKPLPFLRLYVLALAGLLQDGYLPPGVVEFDGLLRDALAGDDFVGLEGGLWGLRRV